MAVNVARSYLSVANDQNNTNWLSNGGFVDYPAGLGLYEDLSADRRAVPADAGDIAIDGLRNFDLVDAKLYQTVNYSFISASSPGLDNVLGYWDIYGTAASVEVAPVTSTGSVITSLDGGNLIRLSFPEAGTVTFDQELSDLKPFVGEQATFAISGRAFNKNVTVTMSLIADDEVVGSKIGQSQTFGDYKRLVNAVTVPITAKKVVYRLEIKGTKGASVGLSGAALFLGPVGPVARFTPSFTDVMLPAGTTIMVEGDTCPAGFRETSFSQDAMAMLTTGQATLRGSELVVASGQDIHDHNPNAALDALTESPSAERHLSSLLLPLSEQTNMHGIPFGQDVGLAGGNQFPNAKPSVVLGIEHTHLLSSHMVSLPPTFALRFCTKI